MLVKDREHVPDILDTLAQLSSDEVPTPPRLAREMLDLLPGEVWTDPDLRWLDPCCKSGVFLREVVVRLLKGLAKWEPDFERRREHIFRNMVFGAAITEITGYVSRRTVYYSRDASGEHSVIRFDEEAGNLPFVQAEHDFKKGRCQVCGAPKDLERGDTRENYAYAFIHGAYPTKEMEEMKFDVIVGNPPYQIDSDGNTRTKPIYQLFVEKAIEMDPRFVLMITPSRWFAGGLGLDGYRARMLTSGSLRRLVDYPAADDCFPGVQIKGGVSYFLWDGGYEGPCEVVTARGDTTSAPSTRPLDTHDVFVRFNEAVDILGKVQAFGEPTLDQHVASRVPFGLQANFRDYRSELFPGAVKIYGSKYVGYIDPELITKNADWLGDYKVLISAAYGAGESVPHQIVGRPIVAGPNEACTDTYLMIRRFESRVEAERFAGVLHTRFIRFLISLRKVAQHTKPSTFAFVPDLPMDREWTDADLYERYGLTDEEIAFIESQVKEMSAPDTAAA
jgi:site-specific DNA-methyltransferase (adenine-specific)